MTGTSIPTDPERVLADEVRDAIAWTATEGDDLRVEVGGGVVTVTGGVRCIADRERVLGAVRDVSGTRVVVDAIAVRSIGAAQVDDRELAVRVRDLLAQLPTIPAGDLHVRVHHGVIVLGGSVGWSFQRDTILDLLGTIDGVRDVVGSVHLHGDGPGSRLSAPEEDRVAAGPTPD